eukprot:PLAT12485.9.p1 GENE.PLAT12485.9~~PLAT12485.9.p1  ORF type:complete len:582 (+),score=287.50 PLAT12485.9:171-1748(+)
MGFAAEVLFWGEVEDLRWMPYSTAYLVSRSRKLFDKYIRRGARLEVALPEGIRSALLAGMADPTLELFTPAQAHVAAMVEKECLPTLLHSAEWENYVAGAGAEEYASLRAGADGAAVPVAFRSRTAATAAAAATGGGGGAAGGSSAGGGAGRASTSSSPRSAADERAGGGSSRPASAADGGSEDGAADGRAAGSGSHASAGGRPARRRLPPAIGRLHSLDGYPIIPFRDILRSSTYCRHFLAFLKSHSYSALLLFWLEVENFKRLPRNSYLKNMARKIFGKYLARTARWRLPMGDDVIAAVEERLASPTAVLFEPAQRAAYLQLRDDWYPAFCADEQGLLLRLELEGKPKTLPKERRSLLVSVEEEPRVSWDSLEDMLADPMAACEFKTFCMMRAAGSCIMLWLEIEDYRAIPSDDYRLLRGRKIVSKYLLPSASQRVPLPDGMLELVQERLAGLDGIAGASRGLFDAIQRHALAVMERELYKDFLTSEQYAHVVEVSAKRVGGTSSTSAAADVAARVSDGWVPV